MRELDAASAMAEAQPVASHLWDVVEHRRGFVGRGRGERRRRFLPRRPSRALVCASVRTAAGSYLAGAAASAGFLPSASSIVAQRAFYLASRFRLEDGGETATCTGLY